MGMVGGGPGAFIGDVHRKAAQLDGSVELVAGAFSRSADKSRQMADELYLDPARCYGSYAEMAKAEKEREDGVDFVSIVTPNFAHFDAAKTFLEAGYHVVCDKPMTLTTEEAIELKAIEEKSGKVFALTHNYTGYPMVKLAKDLVKDNVLGEIIKVEVQYPQGWLIEDIENQGARQAEWRTDPARSGASGCMGDIGTHAENLAGYITGLSISRLCAQLSVNVEGRRLDDDGNCLLEFDNGAHGILCASQVSAGELNGLQIKVRGREGSIFWEQEYPNDLKHYDKDGTIHIYRRGTDAIPKLSAAAAAASRLPFGHPEAFYEAFANIYKNATDTMRAVEAGREPTAIELDFPTATDGVRGLKFIDAVVNSKGKWVEI